MEENIAHSDSTEPTEEISDEEYYILSARCGDLEDVQECIDCGVDVNALDQNQNTALHMASANGHWKNYIGSTALHWAAFNGQIEVVKLLLSFNVDANLKNQNDSTAMDEAIGRSHEDVVLLLSPYTKDEFKAYLVDEDTGEKEEIDLNDEEFKAGEESKEEETEEEAAALAAAIKESELEATEQALKEMKLNAKSGASEEVKPEEEEKKE